MNDEDRFHDIALIVDNCPELLARVMFHIRMNAGHEAEAVERYLKVQAVDDHQRYDRNSPDGRAMLRKALRGMTPPCMAELVRHYVRKHTEGNVMREYLSDELRKLEDAAAK